MTAILQWIQGATGISPQAQASLLISLVSAYGMNAIHLTKDHERTVLSALFWGLDGVKTVLAKLNPIFNVQIQAQLQTDIDRISALETLVKAQQAQLDAATKHVNPQGSPGAAA